MGNVPKIKTAGTVIAQLVGLILNGAAKGIINIKKEVMSIFLPVLISIC